MAIYQKPRTSVPHPEHKIYPYLLRGLAINRPDQVWCADIVGDRPNESTECSANGATECSRNGAIW